MDKPKITLTLTKTSFPNPHDFKVMKATNTIVHLPGDELSKSQVEQLITDGVTVHIVPWK